MSIKLKIITILTVFLSFTACNTPDYIFSEKVSDNLILSDIRKKITEKNSNSPILTHGEISGIFIEKNVSYKFIATINLSKESLSLKMYSLIKNDLVFSAQYINFEDFYDYYADSFFSVKIGQILEKFYYALDIFPQTGEIYTTNENYYVLKDEDKNYYK